MQQMQFRHRTTKKHKCEKHESDEVFFAKASFVGTRLTAS
jgi:hypothetical protein